MEVSIKCRLQMPHDHMKLLYSLKEIANNPKFIKPDQYTFLKVWLGNSLVIANGDRWHKLRKLITPAFHFQTLERFIPIFEEQADILVKKLASIATKESINVLPVFQAFALDVVSGRYENNDIFCLLEVQ